MKKIMQLLLIIILPLFSQEWNSVIPTDIPYINATGAAINQCANKDGIHILVTQTYPSYYLKYYLINSSGSITRYYTLTNQNAEFANIDGNNDKIYIVYKQGNQLKTRKSK